MAKKDYDKIHRTNMDVYARKIEAIYNNAVNEAAAIGSTVSDFNINKLFSFADYPITAARIEKLLRELQNGIEGTILNGIDHEWTLANNKNNELSRRVFGDNIGKLTKEQEQRYFSNRPDARDAFKKRKTSGLGLSDRVWKYANCFKSEIELGIDTGLRDGLSAAEMSRGLKDYLHNPDKLFRRVRNEHGELALSKAAKAYHPGIGVYRSSVRNAQRLARTEINIAYRTADHERWQRMDFVVGIEVRRSNNRSCNCLLCDSLAGKYPKGFKFTGWHPQCRCFAIPILKTVEEMDVNDEHMEQEGEPCETSTNSINSLPSNFTEWEKQNEARLAIAANRGTSPYFIKDNIDYIRTHETIPNNRNLGVVRENYAILFDKYKSQLNPQVESVYIEYTNQKRRFTLNKIGSQTPVSKLNGETNYEAINALNRYIHAKINNDDIFPIGGVFNVNNGCHIEDWQRVVEFSNLTGISTEYLSLVMRFTYDSNWCNTFLYGVPYGYVGKITDFGGLVQDYAYALNYVFEIMPRFSETAFHGVKIPYDIITHINKLKLYQNSGDIFTIKGFVSCSTSIEVANSFTEQLIYVIKCKYGADISKVSAFEDQFEIALRAGSTFKVLKVYQDKNCIYCANPEMWVAELEEF